MEVSDQAGSDSPTAPNLYDSVRTADLPSRTLAKGKVSVAGTLDWDAPDAVSVARLFSRLEVTHLIGRGGMGAVYKARHPGLDRWVAVKLLPAEISEDDNFRKRFEKEARTLASLNHPRIVTAYDFGSTDENHSYIVMEFVEGTDLHSLLQKGRIPPLEAVRLVRDICEALVYAHEQGVVHRDIKPANVLIDQNKRAKVADFGIARLNRRDTMLHGQTTQVVFGTPEYMAPEQFMGRKVDHRADIYSLAVILYECLWGALPEPDQQPIADRLHIDRRIDRIIAKARQSSPDSRYQTAAEMLEDLQQVRLKDPKAAPKPFFDRVLPKTNPERWAWSGAAALLLAGVIAFAIGPDKTTKRDDHSARSATLPTPGPATPRSAPVATGSWQDWLAQGPLPPTLKRVGQDVVAAGSSGEPVQVVFGPVLRNQAARVTFRLRQRQSKANPLYLALQNEEDPTVRYGVYSYTSVWMVNRTASDGKESGLFKADKSAVSSYPIETTLRFEYVDGQITCSIDDETPFTVNCPVTTGRAVLSLTRGAALRRVEWRDLP